MTPESVQHITGVIERAGRSADRVWIISKAVNDLWHEVLESPDLSVKHAGGVAPSLFNALCSALSGCSSYSNIGDDEFRGRVDDLLKAITEFGASKKEAQQEVDQ